MAKKTILAVDDDDDVIGLLRTLTESAGFTFIGVNSGAKCLEALGQTNPCLIIIDVEMPEMDGLETLKKIRADFPKFSAPVAFLTAHKNFKMIERASKLGSETFILKPVDPHRLLERIKDLAGGVKPIM